MSLATPETMEGRRALKAKIMDSGYSGPGHTEKDQKHLKNYDLSNKMLLFSKKFLAFLMGFMGFLAFVSLFLFFRPSEVRGAWFLDNICFWCSGSTQEELPGELGTASALGPVLAAPPAMSPRRNLMNDVSLSIIEEGALLAPRNSLGGVSDGVGGLDDQILVYQVRPGDTPQAIANMFGISINTLLWANDLSNPNRIRAGARLIILPVSGVKHEVQKGDTIGKIVQKYYNTKKYSEDDKRQMAYDVLAYNGISPDDTLVLGDVLIIPDGVGDFSQSGQTSASNGKTPQALASSSRYSKLQDLKGFFMKPIANARRSRGIHGTNGVDLVNSDAAGSSCGRPIFAAAEGTVILAKSFQWNGGYGNYVIISHPHNTQTLYAHMQKVFVAVGQAVTQGQQIGLIGSTGNSTGCHLHFEVRGAQNPF